jgi:hypothetical protein
MSLAGESYPEGLGSWRIAISRDRPIKKHSTEATSPLYLYMKGLVLGSLRCWVSMR